MNIGTVEGVLKLRDEFSAEIKKVRSELDRLQAKSRKVRQEGGLLSKNFDYISGKLKLLAAGAAAAGAAFSIKFVKDAIAAAEVQRQAIAQLEAGLQSTGNVAGFTSKELQKLAKSLQRTTNYSDEATLRLESLLVTFTGIREALPETIRLALDMSARLGQDLKQSAIQLGKALNDPIIGVGALREVGVSFTKAQQEQIKVLQRSGDLYGAQKIILAELRTEFGGSAKASRDASVGAEALNNAFSELQETIGELLTPSVREYTRQLTLTIEEFDKFIKRHDHAIQVLKLFASGQQTQAGMLAAVLALRGKEIAQLEQNSNAYQEWIEKNRAAAAARLAAAKDAAAADEAAREAALKAAKEWHERWDSMIDVMDRIADRTDGFTTSIRAATEVMEELLGVTTQFLQTASGIKEITTGFRSFVEVSGGIPGMMAPPPGAAGVHAAEANNENALRAIEKHWKETWADIANMAADTAQAWRDGFLTTGQALEKIFLDTGMAISKALADAGKEGASQMAAAIAIVASNIGGIIEGGRGKSASALGLGLSGLGMGIGAAFGGPAGAMLGAQAGQALAGVLNSLGIGLGSRGFAGQNIGLEGGQLIGAGGLRGNQNANFEALDDFVKQALGAVNDIFDELGLSLASLGSTFDLIYQDGQGLIVNINGVQRAFGDDFQAAIAYLSVQIAKTAEFAGLSAEAAAAIRQAASEAGDNLEQFASDAADIAAIVAANGPQIPAAVQALRDQFEETKRLADQAARFGLDASGVWDQLNTNVEAFRDSLSRTALLASIPSGQGIDAIRTYFDTVVRPAVMAFNQFAREAGLDEISLADIDAIQRGAVAGERKRQQEAQQEAFDRANDTVQNTTRSFLDLAGQLDPFDEQLRQLAEDYNEAMTAAMEQGIATDDLTTAYNAATAAIEENRLAAERAARQAENQARVQERLAARQTRADFWSFAADLFEQMGKAEEAAKARAMAEWLNLKIGIEQQRLAILVLEAQGRNVDKMWEVWGLLNDWVASLSPDDLIVPVIDAGEQFRDNVIQAADRFTDVLKGAVETLRDLLGVGPGQGNDPFAAAVAPWQDFLDSIAEMTEVQVSAILTELIRQGLISKEEARALQDQGMSLAEIVQQILEEAFGPKMEAALQDVLDGLLEPIRDFNNSLKRGEFGGVSQQQSLDEARAQFEDIVARILAGDTSAFGEFAGAGQNLLDIARAMFGSSLPFQQILDFVRQQGEMIEGLDVADFVDPVVSEGKDRHKEWEQSYAEEQRAADTLMKILVHMESSHDEDSMNMAAQNRSLSNIEEDMAQQTRGRAGFESEVRLALAAKKELELKRVA